MGLDATHLIHGKPLFPLENPGIISIPLGLPRRVPRHLAEPPAIRTPSTNSPNSKSARTPASAPKRLRPIKLHDSDILSPMLESKACVKCGSSEPVIPARVMDRREQRLQKEDLRLRVDADPEAFLFKNAYHSPLMARVCSRCGYTEFYAAEIAVLRDAWRRAEGLDKG